MIKIDPSVSHLCVFLATLFALTLLIITGHDNSQLLHQLLGGVFGGMLGTGAAGSVPALFRFFGGPDSPPPSRQAGFVRPRLLIGLLIACIPLVLVTACATLQQTATTNPVATACASSSAALKVLTTARQAHALNAADIAVVDQAVVVIAPICSAPAEPSPNAATVTAINGALAQLQTLAARVH